MERTNVLKNKKTNLEKIRFKKLEKLIKKQNFANIISMRPNKKLTNYKNNAISLKIYCRKQKKTKTSLKII